MKITSVVEENKNAVYQYIDELRLTQIISNLVSNAIKNPAEEEIEYRYRISRSDNRYTITSFVSNTERGIEPDRLNDIFLPFVQYWAEDRAQGSGCRSGAGYMQAPDRADEGAHMGGVAAKKGSSFLFSFSTPVMIE
ncbi:MAG: ATP-binding protein [Bacteroidales bacterium]|nr:ATP-binding protein [Bacteroidales bacterium]